MPRDRLSLAFVMDPIEALDIDADTTFALMLEAQRRGHEVLYIAPFDLAMSGANPTAQARSASLSSPWRSMQRSGTGTAPSHCDLHRGMSRSRLAAVSVRLGRGPSRGSSCASSCPFPITEEMVTSRGKSVSGANQ